MIEVKKNNFFMNEEVNTILEKIIKNKSFANGYIFYGAEGLGKKQTALKFIKEIFKQSSPSENVEEIITNNNHPDFLIIEPDSLLATKSSERFDPEKTIKSGYEIIKIAQIRNIKTFLSQKSINSEKKIVLIIDAHLLNEAASNCLLKTLEEPSNGIFILLTSKLNLLLDTIVSRCQLVRFRPFSSKQINFIFFYSKLVIAEDKVPPKVTTQQYDNWTYQCVESGKDKNCEEGILKGMYKIKEFNKYKKTKIQLLGSGTILREMMSAAEILQNEYQVDSEIWSVTSFNELRKDGMEVERYNLLNPDKEPKKSFVEQCLGQTEGPIMAASDYMRMNSDQIRPYTNKSFYSLGADGFGRSDTRKNLRKFFEVDKEHLVAYGLSILAKEQLIPSKHAKDAMKKYNIDINKPMPTKL